MLFERVDGRQLAQSMSLERAPDMGELAAHLHEPAPAVDVAHEPPLIADRVLYWHVENRLPLLAEFASLIGEALDRAQQFLDQLRAHRPHAPSLIHGDLTPDNVIVADGRLVPIHFQDLVWGFDIQDVAIALDSFSRYPDAERLRRQFRSGYERVRAWPDLNDATLTALIAARRLHQLNLSMTLRRPGLSTYIDRSLSLIGQWMN